MNKEGTSYNNPLAVKLDGILDSHKLEYSFKELIQRHESFRTAFIISPQGPVQVIHDEVPFTLEYFESNGNDAVGLSTNFVRPFNLENPPLLRARLIKTEQMKYILMLDISHIIWDAVSFEIFVKEFMAIYHGKNLPALELQYKDFSDWQNRNFISGGLSEQKKYWLSTFSRGDIPVLNIPTDYPRPPVRNIESGDQVIFPLDKDLCGKIYLIIEKAKVTLSMFLFAVYNVLLHHLTRQEDFATGIVISGRTHADLENIIGMFVNTLPIRNYPAGNKSFAEFLEEVKENSLNAYENQDYPFDELVFDLGLQGKIDRNPLFDVSFSFTNVIGNVEKGGDTQNQAADLNMLPYENNDVNFSKFDLTLYAEEGRGMINLYFRYSTQLFKPSTMTQLKKYYIEIIEQVVDNIEVKLMDIRVSHRKVMAKSEPRQFDKDNFLLT